MTSERDARTARGQCPACGMPVPFSRAAIGGRGKPFECKACRRSIEVPKLRAVQGGLIGVAGLLLVKLFGYIAILPIALIIAMASWLLAPVRLVEPSDVTQPRS